MYKKLLKLWHINCVKVMNSIYHLSLSAVVLAVLRFMVLMECMNNSSQVEATVVTEHDDGYILLLVWRRGRVGQGAQECG